MGCNGAGEAGDLTTANLSRPPAEPRRSVNVENQNCEGEKVSGTVFLDSIATEPFASGS